MMDAGHRSQIEKLLGRKLAAVELVPAKTLKGISPAQRQIAEDLSRSALVLCAYYLHSIVPASLQEIKRFMDMDLRTSTNGY